MEGHIVRWGFCKPELAGCRSSTKAGQELLCRMPCGGVGGDSTPHMEERFERNGKGDTGIEGQIFLLWLAYKDGFCNGSTGGVRTARQLG